MDKPSIYMAARQTLAALEGRVHSGPAMAALAALRAALDAPLVETPIRDAALDLLAALRELREVSCPPVGKGSEGLQPFYERAMKMAEAAIAKAEGR